MHLGTELATTTTVTSMADQNGEQGFHSAQSGTVNHNEPMHYEGSGVSGYGHIPVPYRAVSVFPHPAGYAIGMPLLYYGRGVVSAPTVMPDQAQFSLIQQEVYPISIGHNLPVVCHSHAQIPAAYGLIPNAVQTGNIYHQESLYGSLHPWNANQRIPGHGMVHHVARSHHTGGSLNSGYIHGWPGMSVNPGVMHRTNPRANSLSSNIRVPRHQPQQHFPVSYSRAPGLGRCQRARLRDDSNRFIPDPTASSRPLSRSHAGLSSEDLARFSRMSLRNTSRARLPNEQNPFGLQHGHESINRVPPIVPSPTTGECINVQNRPGRNSQVQRNQLNRFNQTSLRYFSRNRNQPASSSRQFTCRKIQTSPSNGQYRPFVKNIYHISWDGFETRCEPVGLNCNLCNGDLGYAPGNIECNPPLLPEVSVLSCGHAFHSECFQSAVIQEQSADPPCYFCTLHRP